uniref:Uncharacterized protein n=1 Tax=viral metagenome TaxID=1070528 RepID=A0A6M3LRQ1_9ZZZZ
MVYDDMLQAEIDDAARLVDNTTKAMAMMRKCIAVRMCDQLFFRHASIYAGRLVLTVEFAALEAAREWCASHGWATNGTPTRVWYVHDNRSVAEFDGDVMLWASFDTRNPPDVVRAL